MIALKQAIKSVPASVVWPIRHKVMYPDKEFDSIKLPDDEKGIHLALFEEDKLISVLSLFKADDGLQFRKFATIQERQGKGYGSKLLYHVIDYAKQENISRIWCNSRVSASAFYKKFGFKETDKTYHKDGIDFIIMERISI